jgi:hypothetical protein
VAQTGPDAALTVEAVAPDDNAALQDWKRLRG